MDVRILYTDGGSRGNPGHAAWAFMAYDGDGVECRRGSGYIGDHHTNSESEYRAVIEGLKALDGFTGIVEVYSDSLLVISQLQGQWRVKRPHLRKLYAKVVAALRGFHEVRFMWRSRKTPEIMLADTHVNAVLDQVMYNIPMEADHAD